MTRIKYKLNSSTDWYESIPILTGYSSTTAMYKDLTYKLVSYDTGITILEKTCVSSHALKKNIKKSMVEIGAIFSDEIRPKK